LRKEKEEKEKQLKLELTELQAELASIDRYFQNIKYAPLVIG